MVVTGLAGLPPESRPGGANRGRSGREWCSVTIRNLARMLVRAIVRRFISKASRRDNAKCTGFCMCGFPHTLLAMTKSPPVDDVDLRHHQNQLLPLSLRHVGRVPSEKRRVSKLKGLAAKASVG
jgi:hypothetical protein